MRKFALKLKNKNSLYQNLETIILLYNRYRKYIQFTGIALPLVFTETTPEVEKKIRKSDKAQKLSHIFS